MSALAKLSILFVSLFITSFALSKEPLTHAQKIAALIDPVKLSTLAPRGANPRVQKYVAQLFEAQQAGLDPVRCATEAAAIAGMTSINSFVLNAAIDKAKQIMERERALKLSQRDAMMLADALDAPTKPNARLQQAAERYKAKT